MTSNYSKMHQTLIKQHNALQSSDSSNHEDEQQILSFLYIVVKLNTYGQQ
jgi:hypothetical protein